MERMTAAEAIVRYLIHEGVPYVLGILGHGNVQLGEALHKYRAEITFISVKNEQNAVHMAAAYAKMTGQPLAVTTSIGPGATNLVTGAGAAHVNRLPVLLLPGDSSSDHVGPVLQYVEGNSDVEARANDTLKPVSRYWMRINRPQQLQRALPEAFDRMMQPGLQGPAVLALPMDVQAEAYDFDVEALFQPRDVNWEQVSSDPKAISRAADLIVTAERPLIIAGGGVLMAEAWDALKSFAECIHAPVAHTQSGNGALLFEHSLNVFSIGPNGADCGNILAERADLIIGVGTRYSDFTTSSETLFSKASHFININVNPVDAGKQRALKLVGDANAVLHQLESELVRYNMPPRSNYLKEISHLRELWIAHTDEARNEGATPISQAAAIGVLNNFAEPSDVVVCAAGSLPGDLLRLWRTQDPTHRGYHMEYGYSTMGYEIAGAMGAKLADPSREVYALLGDGSFLMAPQELATALQESIPITVLLFDSHGHRSIEGVQTGNAMHAFGTQYRMRNPVTKDLSGDYLPLDLMKIAEGFGAQVFEADSRHTLLEVLKAAKAETQRPSFIYIPISSKQFKGTHSTWWNVPIPESSEDIEALERYREMRGSRRIL